MGMTTNERLCEVGLMREFDNAVRERDADKIRNILERVFVDQQSIDIIISQYIGSAEG